MATVLSRSPAPDKMRLDEIPDVAALIPWSVTDISLRPFKGSWSMNPSVHFDGETWRCIIRCADYAMPGGVTVRGAASVPGYVISRNAMLIIDPTNLRVEEVIAVQEADPEPRLAKCTNVGYEDVRLFRTQTGGLQGIAASLHLDRSIAVPKPSLSMYQRRALRSPKRVQQRDPIMRGRIHVGNVAQPAPTQARRGYRAKGDAHPPEQVVITFDDQYRIVEASPLRGPWSGRPQKNWSPFDGAAEPHFLYSIEEGTVFDMNGPLGDATFQAGGAPPTRNVGTTEVRLMRNPVALNSGRGGRAGYRGIRGGTQLHYLGAALDRLVGYAVSGGAWIGLGHDMRFVHGKKFYWHVLYMCDSAGTMLAVSEPFKLEPDHGIEFAAGIAIDGDRVVISYGVDDMMCKLGETSLEALVGLLDPLEAPVGGFDGAIPPSARIGIVESDGETDTSEDVDDGYDGCL